MPVVVDYIWNDKGQRTNIRPLSSELVTVKQAGNITEVTYTSRRSKGGTTRKISKDEYVDIRDGQVKEFNHQDRRSDDLKSVSRSMKQGRDMINANVINPAEWRWITLTYAENMTDQKKLYNDNLCRTTASRRMAHSSSARFPDRSTVYPERYSRPHMGARLRQGKKT